MRLVVGKFTQFDEMTHELSQKMKDTLARGGFEIAIAANNKYYIMYEMEDPIVVSKDYYEAEDE